MRVHGGIGTLVVLAGLALASPAPASASFHLIKVREVAPNPAGMNAAFIELQMYAPGQIQLTGHPVRIYNAAGGLVTNFALPANAPNGDNQRTFLIGDDDTVGGADLVNQQLSTALGPLGPGGAVCFDNVDCMSWGSFTAPAGTLLSPAGSPAPAVTDGSSVTRSIAPGCATLLEDSDDTNASATDFTLTVPSPRRNSVTPTEQACGGPGGGAADTTAPNTTIDKQPKKRSPKKKAKFKFSSSEQGSKFECRLDGGAFKSCSSPFKANVAFGKHRFQVRATDPAGNTDPTPAKAKFKRVPN